MKAMVCRRRSCRRSGRNSTAPTAPSTREAGGTGIGLSLVRAIADTLHGACGAENVEGGICFWFELPDLLPAEDSKIKD